MNKSNKRSLSEISPELLKTNKKFNTAEMTTISLAEIEKSLSRIIDDKIRDLPRKSDLVGLFSDVHNLKESNEKLHQEFEKLKSKNEELEKKIDLLEKRSREKNLIFSIPKAKANDIQKSVIEIAKTLQGEERIEIEDFTALPSKGEQQLVLVETKSKQSSNKLLKNSNKLKGTGVYVNPDYTKNEMKRRHKLLEIRKAIKTKHPTEEPQIRGLKLVVNGKSFHTTHEGEIYCGSRNGPEVLFELFGDIGMKSNNTTQQHQTSKQKQSSVTKKCMSNTADIVISDTAVENHQLTAAPSRSSGHQHLVQSN